MRYLGIDPGMSGAIAMLDGERVETVVFAKTTPREWSDFLLRHGGCGSAFALIEAVHSFPGQGVSSTFKFGHAFGMLEGLLIAQNVPYERVRPLTWQTGMSCRTKGDKNVSKRKAEELFPQVKCTHANSDALLIAEYCRRIRNGRSG